MAQKVKITTKKRVKKATKKTCPTCKGTGKVNK